MIIFQRSREEVLLHCLVLALPHCKTHQMYKLYHWMNKNTDTELAILWYLRFGEIAQVGNSNFHITMVMQMNTSHV